MPKKPKNPTPSEDEAVEKSVEELMGPVPQSPTPPPADSTETEEPSSAPLVDANGTPLETIEPAPEAAADGDRIEVKVASAKDKKSTDEVTTAPEVPEEKLQQAISPEPEAPTESGPAPQEPPADEPDIEAAVNDIVAKESDAVLEAEDQKVAEAFSDKKPSLNDRLKHFFVSWWENKKARYGTFAAITVAIVAILAVPTTRYVVLNSVGVRSGVSLTVVDSSTRLPLRNVSVAIGGTSTRTDQNGYVKLSGLKLGKTELKIERRAFADVRRTLTLGWGSNPLGEFQLTPIGTQYTFIVKDFMSDKPIEKAEAISGAASAFSDKNGKIVLTVDEADATELEVTIEANSYRDEVLQINADTEGDQQVAMVPARKHVFVSKRSGTYDVYKIDVDGSNEELLLAGTGHERDDLVLVPHPTADIVALVSTRDNKRNNDGYLLSTLTVIDVDSGETTDIAQSEQIQLIGWVGDRLVYAQIAAGESAESPHRHRLKSYNYVKDDSLELAASNYFNDVLLAGGSVYFAPSLSTGGKDIGLYKIAANGTARQTILNKEVWNIFRASHDKLYISAQQEWYEHTIGNGEPTKMNGAPANARSRVYTDNPDGLSSLWVEERDGKGVLLSYDTEEREDEILRTQSGLHFPVYWLNERYLVYRINTDEESADYVMNTDGGEPRKIQDVSNTGGIDRWYFY